VQSGGWHALGHLPSAPDDLQDTPGQIVDYRDIRVLDVAETAAASVRRRAVLRIHPALWPVAGEGTAAAELNKMALDEEQRWRLSEIRDLLERLLNDENPGWPLSDEQRGIIKHLAKKEGRLAAPEPYPNSKGFVLTARELLPRVDSDEANDTDADALLESSEPQELFSHTNDVVARLESALDRLPLAPWREALIAAAVAHDWGKIDPRFQALLRGSTAFAAMASEVFLAKSGTISSSIAARRAARDRAGLPPGFRHEMLSVQLAGTPEGLSALPTSSRLRCLALHLIATHHGYARPFAPLVKDDAPPEVSLSLNDKTVVVSGVTRTNYRAHALDSGLVERFWQMNRHYGWWGVALFETVIRLADQQASVTTRTRSLSATTVATSP
jgi:CRISPR-associated endonuclease/helicase Cas3